MKKTILRVITGAYAVILTACAPATTAFANTGKEAECICSVRCEKKINDTCPACREDVALCQGTPKVEDERDEKKDDQAETDGKPLTPDGNLNLIDDYGTKEEDKSGKQFLTFTTKNGNYFYMIVDRDDSGDFVKAIISIGHMFHCKVISEGVELDCQLETLRKLKCDYIQGYIWGKPQEKSSAVQLIEGVAV